MDVKENAEGCGWMNLGHDSDQQQKVVNMVMTIRFTKRKGGGGWLAERWFIVLRRTVLCRLRSVSS
jgi:hypothetical protein